MSNKLLKSKVLRLCALLALLTACVQPANFAPVKTVIQTVEPDNGYVPEKPPIKSGNKPIKARQSVEIMVKEKTFNQTKQEAVVSKPPYQYQANQNLTNQVVKNEAITTSKTISGQNRRGKEKTRLESKVENVHNNLPIAGVGRNQSSTPQKILATALETSSQWKEKVTVSSAEKIDTKKNLQKNTKKLDNIQITEKNNKKSIISIDNKKMLKLYFQWPLQGRVSRNFSQTDNKGIEITGKMGQSVHATEAGKAVYCGQGLSGFGNLAIIKHNETYLSAYANNSKLYIKEGQKVGKGQMIGQVGQTGLKKASLHFEIRKNGKPVNPLTLLPKH